MIIMRYNIDTYFCELTGEILAASEADCVAAIMKILVNIYRTALITYLLLRGWRYCCRWSWHLMLLLAALSKRRR